MKQFEFEMGMPVKDLITGFKGVITGVARYITGCDQYLVQPPASEGKHEEGIWFDETRLEKTKGKQVILPEADLPGAEHTSPAPIK